MVNGDFLLLKAKYIYIFNCASKLVGEMDGKSVCFQLNVLESIDLSYKSWSFIPKLVWHI